MVSGVRAGPSTDHRAAPVRLFCFAHAGGGSGLFQPWRRDLLPDLEVWPVVLPGREARVRERPYPRIEEALPPVCRTVASHTGRAYALFGHSMGAVLAYEVARRLRTEGHPDPVCLFVSGRRAPHLPARHPPLHRLPEEQFLAAMTRLNGTPEQVLQHGELLRLFLPALRADFQLNEVYTPLPGPRLACPVSALTGDADPEVDPEEMAGWRDTTSGGFTLRVFRGDHFYLKGTPGDVLAAIQVDVRRLGSIVGSAGTGAGIEPDRRPKAEGTVP